MCRFSNYIQDLVANTTANSTLFLGGFHIMSFNKINKFCRKHINDPLPLNFGDWDREYLKDLEGINLHDFVQTCNYYEFTCLITLFS